MRTNVSLRLLEIRRSCPELGMVPETSHGYVQRVGGVYEGMPVCLIANVGRWPAVVAAGKAAPEVIGVIPAGAEYKCVCFIHECCIKLSLYLLTKDGSGLKV